MAVQLLRHYRTLPPHSFVIGRRFWATVEIKHEKAHTMNPRLVYFDAAIVEAPVLCTQVQSVMNSVPPYECSMERDAVHKIKDDPPNLNVICKQIKSTAQQMKHRLQFIRNVVDTTQKALAYTHTLHRGAWNIETRMKRAECLSRWCVIEWVMKMEERRIGQCQSAILGYGRQSCAQCVTCE